MKPETITRTEAFVLEPQVRTYGRRRYWGAALAGLAFALLAALAVIRLGALEVWLATDNEAARAIVYEIPNGSELAVPIDPRTDVIRFVAHAYRRDAALSALPSEMRVHVRIEAARGVVREEALTVAAAQTVGRVTSNEATLHVADPFAFDVDLHGTDAERLVLRFDGVAGAEGLMARAYRRERLSTAAAVVRDTALDRTRKDAMARWAWELGWDELTAPEKSELLATRWHRIGQLHDGARDLRSIAVEIAPKPPLPTLKHEDVLLARIALRGNEQVTCTLHTNTTIRVSADEAADLVATTRTVSGQTLVRHGRGEVVVEPASEERGLEVMTERDTFVDVRAASDDGIEWLTRVTAWRIARSRPVIVRADGTPRVVRVSLRTVIDRRDDAPYAADVRVETSAPGRPPLVQSFREEHVRSRVDRYEDTDPPQAPSERATFYVAVPARGEVRIWPQNDGLLDVTLAELDVAHAPEPLPTRAAEELAYPPRREGESELDSFVPRRPSNVADFPADARIVLRLGHRIVARPEKVAGAPAPLLAFVVRQGPKVDAAQRVFVDAPEVFRIADDARRPLVLPMAFLAAHEAPATVSLRIDPKSPPPLGLYRHWTRSRAVVATDHERHGAMTLGDDVPRGDHELVVEAARNDHVRIHLPWQHGPLVPRWTAGLFEE